MTGETEKRTVKSVDTACNILEYLRETNGATVSDVATHTSLSAGSVHTHLTTLKEHGYVVQEGDRYKLGPLLLTLGEHVRNKNLLYRASKEEIDVLADETNECVHLVIEYEGRLVTLYEAFGENAVGTEYHTKKREEPIQHHHCTAAGKAMLSRYSRERVETILDRHGMPVRTPNTITDREKLFEELSKIRDRGFAISNEEQIVGIRAVGAPITAPDGEVLGAISVSGPTSRLKDDICREEISEQVIRTVNIAEININTINE